MPDPKTRLRRFTAIVKDLCNLDLGAIDVLDQVATLQARAHAAYLGPKRLRRSSVSLDSAREKAQRARRFAGLRTRARVMPHITKARRQGAQSYAAVADALNREGVKPPRAKRWTKSMVRAVELRTNPQNLN
jgi:hypothetical protein